MIKVVKFLKANLFLTVIALGYLGFALFSPVTALQGIKNSGYYLKEMLMIMPVIFVLTALIDTFVPKDTIIKYLGKESKAKGVLLSFVLGSISAGPIYAAFPFCVMLHKKGASIRNMVIILSAWAVVKVPMLLNEAKFLGFKFMAVRWILTIAAILVFSWMANRVINEGDIPQTQSDEKQGVFVNKNACMGCTLCTQRYPELFYMEGKKARVSQPATVNYQKLNNVIAACPVQAIEYQ